MFITFEGGEGAGKSTQIRQLESYLTSKGFDVVVTREPGGSPGAEAIRHVILSGGVEKNGPQLEALLFAAARIDHVERLIRPALQRGAIVLCDRFIDSTRAYQGTQGNLDPAFLEGLEKVAVGDTMPDLTIILDIMAEKGLERAALRRGTGGVDRFEREDITLHRKRRAAFLRIAEREPERCVVLDADRNPDLIAADVAAIVDTFITQKPRRKRKPYV